MAIYSGHLYRYWERGSRVFNLVQDSFLFQHVLEPTRGKNVLDIVLSKQKEYVSHWGVVDM